MNSLVLITLAVAGIMNANPEVKKNIVKPKIGGENDTIKLEMIDILERKSKGFTISRMNDVGTGVLFGAKKAERVYVGEAPSNLATNNARQVFAGVAGINVWDAEPAGVSMNIGARGLSPNRMINFTSRQNGYDISADPMGYPESYYTPALQAVDHIDVVRGAGALRYGTQFGGTINFVMKEGSRTKPLSALVNLSGGSYGFASGYAEAGGTSGASNYIGIAQYRRTDAWRANNGFDQFFAYGAYSYQFTPNLRLKVDATRSSYIAQQPGGVTDSVFALNPQSSTRARNWMEIQWNMGSATLDWQLTKTTSLRSITFMNGSTRNSVGNNAKIIVPDTQAVRLVTADNYLNIGNETTIRHDDTLAGMQTSWLGGFRLYRGSSQRKQGNGSTGSDANFTLTSPQHPEVFAFDYPSMNAALFSEMLLYVTPSLKVVPGIRYDYINTEAHGEYRLLGKDSAGQTIATFPGVHQHNARGILLGGVGISYTIPASDVELYANATQNYRAINFSDLRVTSPSLVIDSALRDATGYTLDAGVRGTIADIVSWDVSAFSIEYRNRIGEIDAKDATGKSIRLRTNLSDAYSRGIEWVSDVNLARAMGLSQEAPSIHWMMNATALESKYRSAQIASIDGKQLEYAPQLNIRTGINAHYAGVGVSVLYSHVSKQYADATNKEFDASGALGAIPAYSVMDVTVGYSIGRYRLDVSCNNLLDARYFTRRSDAIIPAEARSITGSISVSL